MQTSPTIEILGVPIARLTPDGALERIARLHDDDGAAVVAYANAHTLNLAAGDPSYREILRRAALVLNDGIGLALAARVHGRPFPANLNGTDFNPRILELAAQRAWPVYLLGGRAGVAERAAARLRERIPDLNVVGTASGYFAPAEGPAIIEAIRGSGASVLMVAMGNPLQEKWLSRHLEATGARLGIGVGAFFDFSAGEVPRAPAWMNRMGIEWVFRLLQEPRRMWRRYVVGNPLFLARVLRDRFRRRS